MYTIQDSLLSLWLNTTGNAKIYLNLNKMIYFVNFKIDEQLV